MNTIRTWFYNLVGSPVDRAVAGVKSAIANLESAAKHHEENVAERIKQIEKAAVEKVAHEAELLRANRIAAKLRALVE